MRRKKNILVLNAGVGKVTRRYKGLVTREDVRRKFVFFAGVLFVGLLMLALIIWGVASVVTEIIAPDKESAVYAGEEETYGDADSLSLLAIKLSDDSSAIEQMVLSRFEAAEGGVYICGLSPRVAYRGKTFGEYFAEGGTAALTEAVAGFVGCERIYAASMTYTQLRRVINVFGGVTITVPYDINYKSPEGDRNIVAAAGTREYTGWELARLLGYPGWQGGEREQSYMYATVVANLLNERLRYETVDELKNVLRRLDDECTIEINMTDFQFRSRGLLHLASLNDGEIAAAFDVWPRENADGTLEYGGDDLELIKAAFADRGEE